MYVTGVHLQYMDGFTHAHIDICQSGSGISLNFGSQHEQDPSALFMFLDAVLVFIVLCDTINTCKWDAHTLYGSTHAHRDIYHSGSQPDQDSNVAFSSSAQSSCFRTPTGLLPLFVCGASHEFSKHEFAKAFHIFFRICH